MKLTDFGTLYCIGRNYLDHAKELGNAVPTELVVFIKPRSSLNFGDAPIRLPVQSEQVDHEVELVLRVGKIGKKVARDEAYGLISHVAVGLDLTARDLQKKAKEAGLPWAVAKGFDTFAGLGNLIAAPAQAAQLESASFWIEVNGVAKQRGSPREMIFAFEHLISELSQIFTLYPGDLIFTGTPAGVSPLKDGDRVQAILELKNGERSEIRCPVQSSSDVG